MGGAGAGITSLGTLLPPYGDTSNCKPSWASQGGLGPQPLNGLVSVPTKAGPVPVPPAPLPSCP